MPDWPGWFNVAGTGVNTLRTWLHPGVRPRVLHTRFPGHGWPLLRAVDQAGFLKI